MCAAGVRGVGATGRCRPGAEAWLCCRLPVHAGLRVGRRHEWGVFATRPLPAGTLLGELCGMVCTGEVRGAAGWHRQQPPCGSQLSPWWDASHAVVTPRA